MTPHALPAALAALTAVPVEPDPDEARRLLLEELAKPVYQAAKPTWFDLAAQAVLDWLQQLLAQATRGDGAIALVVVVVLLTALVVTVLLVLGRPRLGRRSRTAGGVFGAEDVRTADELRAAAARAADGGDWTTAVLELFRALARGLEERTVVTVYPGLTAHALAGEAARAFPAAADRLAAAADDFDAVRYLARPGTPEQYERVAAVERELRAATPAGLVAP